MAHHEAESTYVWDRFVRLFHWTVVAAFAVAYVAEDDLLEVHVWAGYVVAVLVLLRVAWGLLGTPHARFADFLYSPAVVAGYVRDLFLFRARRYLGHSPGGGAMVVLLLICLALTTGTGLIVYGASEKAGPLAPLFAASSPEMHLGVAAPVRRAMADEDDRDADRAERGNAGGAFVESMEEVHEFFANLTLGLAIVHIGAVLFASFVHRENLVRAMITGYKRRSDDPGH